MTKRKTKDRPAPAVVHVQKLPATTVEDVIEAIEDEGTATVIYPEEFKGQERCEHDVPVGLHADYANGKLGHDCAYTNARTALIPAASKEASTAVGYSPGSREWMIAFSAIMDRLVRERRTA